MTKNHFVYDAPHTASEFRGISDVSCVNDVWLVPGNEITILGDNKIRLYVVCTQLHCKGI